MEAITLLANENKKDFTKILFTGDKSLSQPHGNAAVPSRFGLNNSYVVKEGTTLEMRK